MLDFGFYNMDCSVCVINPLIVGYQCGAMDAYKQVAKDLEVCI